jgi:hypothetical protein
MPNVALQEPYLRTGISMVGNTLAVDLSEPRTIVVHGLNSKTGEEKTYLLKVTQFGKLLLV